MKKVARHIPLAIHTLPGGMYGKGDRRYVTAHSKVSTLTEEKVFLLGPLLQSITRERVVNNEMCASTYVPFEKSQIRGR